VRAPPGLVRKELDLVAAGGLGVSDDVVHQLPADPLASTVARDDDVLDERDRSSRVGEVRDDHEVGGREDRPVVVLGDQEPASGVGEDLLPDRTGPVLARSVPRHAGRGALAELLQKVE
jgi:hypothetical protein